MVPFYNAKDQAIYNAGDKFMSQSKYLLNDYVPTEGISYEGDGSPVSYANSMGGIMTQAPIIYPPINQGGGGGGGGGFTGPTGPGSYDSQFDPVTENKAFNEDIGVGTIAEEDDEEEGKIGKMGLAKIAGATLFGGPFSGAYTAYNERQKAKQKEIDKINAAIEAQYGPSDPGLRGNDGTPGFGITAAGNYTNQFEGGDPGLGGGTTGGFDTGGGKEMMARGGRAGYFFGGRIGFRGGGMDASSDDFGGGNTPGPGDTGGEGGNNPTDNSNTQFDGGNNDGASDNPPVAVVDNNPVDISTVTKSIGNYDIPYGLEALLENKGKFKAVINPEEILEKNLGVDFTYDKGPYQVGFNADMEGNKNLGISYNKGNLSAYANTDFDNPSLGFKYSKTFANGGLASIL